MQSFSLFPLMISLFGALNGDFYVDPVAFLVTSADASAVHFGKVEGVHLHGVFYHHREYTVATGEKGTEGFVALNLSDLNNTQVPAEFTAIDAGKFTYTVEMAPLFQKMGSFYGTGMRVVYAADKKLQQPTHWNFTPDSSTALWTPQYLWQTEVPGAMTVSGTQPGKEIAVPTKVVRITSGTPEAVSALSQELLKGVEGDAAAGKKLYEQIFETVALQLGVSKSEVSVTNRPELSEISNLQKNWWITAVPFLDRGHLVMPVISQPVANESAEAVRKTVMLNAFDIVRTEGKISGFTVFADPLIKELVPQISLECVYSTAKTKVSICQKIKNSGEEVAVLKVSLGQPNYFFMRNPQTKSDFYRGVIEVDPNPTSPTSRTVKPVEMATSLGTENPEKS